MVRIRLRRHGAKGQPTYRIVVADSRSPRDGRFIEIIGHYNPRTDPIDFKVDTERAQHWLSVGAQPSDPVKRLLVKVGVLPSDLPTADEQPAPELEVAEPESANGATSESEAAEEAEPQAAEEAEPEATEEAEPEATEEAEPQAAEEAEPQAAEEAEPQAAEEAEPQATEEAEPQAAEEAEPQAAEEAADEETPEPEASEKPASDGADG